LTIVVMSNKPVEVSRLLPEWQSESNFTLAPIDSLLWARIVAWLRSVNRASSAS
jgi:hypothetical protein